MTEDWSIGGIVVSIAAFQNDRGTNKSEWEVGYK